MLARKLLPSLQYPFYSKLLWQPLENDDIMYKVILDLPLENPLELELSLLFSLPVLHPKMYLLYEDQKYTMC